MAQLLAPIAGVLPQDERVIVGPGTADDAGVFLFDERALVATVDIITPLCDDPLLFGRIAATNSLSDVYAMGAKPLFALNVCCFPEGSAPSEVLTEILRGAAEALADAGAALLGGHSIKDKELKFGLAVIGEADPSRLLVNAAARAGERLILTKPLGTGVLINAYRAGRLDETRLRPALDEMTRLNDVAARLALHHGCRAATDVTGFGIAGHSLEIARASRVRLRIAFDELRVYEPFFAMVEAGVSTAGTRENRRFALEAIDDLKGLDDPQWKLLFDPQTSGGLLIAVPDARASALLDELLQSGHQASLIGEVLEGPARIEIV
ncbi:MAG: selenide, water dikinase SelD [Acidobacteriota bacterium]|nr:MAG: selenide, water dikinase SelD [Acidobacteriota bacterium]